MLEKYARDNGFENVLFLADDGYTGTNFERPSWKQIEEMIKRGEVETFYVPPAKAPIRSPVFSVRKRC